MKRAKKAFTLVELLVVISIIAILLAVLMPALSKVREQGRAIVCASNLKNYGPALLMYAQENNGKSPFSFSWFYSRKTIENGKCQEACRWHYDLDKPDGLLWPYLKAMEVHMCPTFKSYAMAGGLDGCPNKQSGHSNRPGSGGTKVFNPRYSYSMNRWIGFYNLEIYNYQPGTQRYNELFAQAPSLKLSNVKRSSQCLAFSEQNLWPIDHRADDGAKYYAPHVLEWTDLWLYANSAADAVNMAYCNIATYHNVSSAKRNEGKANIVFVDGHVARIRGKAGYDAYLEYGRPWYGHEKLRIW
jgi:prepilin-type N-terminal cleavage/methylation domain-containing protein/prepilin-type processing-associated H-X9-DG protein